MRKKALEDDWQQKRWSETKLNTFWKNEDGRTEGAIEEEDIKETSKKIRVISKLKILLRKVNRAKHIRQI